MQGKPTPTRLDHCYQRKSSVVLLEFESLNPLLGLLGAGGEIASLKQLCGVIVIVTVKVNG